MGLTDGNMGRAKLVPIVIALVVGILQNGLSAPSNVWEKRYPLKRVLQFRIVRGMVEQDLADSYLIYDTRETLPSERRGRIVTAEAGGSLLRLYVPMINGHATRIKDITMDKFSKPEIPEKPVNPDKEPPFIPRRPCGARRWSEKQKNIKMWQFQTLYRSPIQVITSDQDGMLSIQVTLKLDQKSKLMIPIKITDLEPADPESKLVINIQYE